MLAGAILGARKGFLAVMTFEVLTLPGFRCWPARAAATGWVLIGDSVKVVVTALVAKRVHRVYPGLILARPQQRGNDQQQRRIDHQRPGDRHAVGGGQPGRGLERQHDDQHPDEQDGVDGGQEHLAAFVFGGLPAPHRRQQIQLHRLAGQ